MGLWAMRRKQAREAMTKESNITKLEDVTPTQNEEETEETNEEKVDLSTLEYKELQALAKEKGIEKTNIKKEELIAQLSEVM